MEGVEREGGGAEVSGDEEGGVCMHVLHGFHVCACRMCHVWHDAGDQFAVVVRRSGDHQV